jgi:hypothetical protein
MGVSASEVGYTSATTGRGEREVHKGHVVALGEGDERKKTLMAFRIYRIIYLNILIIRQTTLLELVHIV